MLSTLAASGAGIAFGGVGLIILLLVIAASVFWIWMLIDALMNEPTPVEKLLWFCVIFFLHLLGAIIYFAVRRSGRTTRLA